MQAHLKFKIFHLGRLLRKRYYANATEMQAINFQHYRYLNYRFHKRSAARVGC